MTKIKISVLCPTRKRMHLMERVVESCFKTCSNPDKVEVIFGIDDDDTESIEMAKTLKKEHPTRNIEYTVWPRKKYIFSDLMNQCAKPAKGEIFNLMSDDAIHITEGWDTKAIEQFDQFPDKIILVQTAGGTSPNTGFPFMHKNWRTAAGYILPPTFNGDWADWWLTDVIQGVPGSRLIYCTSIEIRHLHVEAGNMEADQTYREHRAEREAQESLPKSEHPYHGTEGKEMKRIEIENLKTFVKTYQKEEEPQ